MTKIIQVLHIWSQEYFKDLTIKMKFTHLDT
jgi:hypothetical protein